MTLSILYKLNPKQAFEFLAHATSVSDAHRKIAGLCAAAASSATLGNITFRVLDPENAVILASGRYRVRDAKLNFYFCDALSAVPDQDRQDEMEDLIADANQAIMRELIARDFLPLAEANSYPKLSRQLTDTQAQTIIDLRREVERLLVIRENADSTSYILIFQSHRCAFAMKYADTGKEVLSIRYAKYPELFQRVMTIFAISEVTKRLFEEAASYVINQNGVKQNKKRARKVIRELGD